MPRVWIPHTARIRAHTPISCVHVTCELNGLVIIEKPFSQTILFLNSFFFIFICRETYSPVTEIYNLYIFYCILKLHLEIRARFYFIFLMNLERGKGKWFASSDSNENILFWTSFFCYSSNWITVVHSFSV